MTHSVYSAPQGKPDHIEFNGFPIELKTNVLTLIVSSPYPTVLSQTYDLVRRVCRSKLLQCQSLYSRDSRHAMCFQLASPPPGKLLDELDHAATSWSLLRAASL